MLQRLLIPILGMPRFIKRGVVLGVDTALCVLTVWLAYYLRIGDWVGMDGNAFWRPWDAAIASLALALPLFIMNGLYRAIFRYSGLAALVAIFKAMAYYMAIYATVFTFIGMQGVPRTVGIIQPILLLVLVVASRLLARFWLGDLYRVQSRGLLLPKVFIYGAGNAGRQLAMAMASNHSMRVAGFLDDDDRLHGHSLNGLYIYNPADLPALVPSLEIKTVLLAIPSANRQRRLEIINGIQQAHVQVRTLPDLSEIAQGRVSLSDLRELDVDELLGRDPVSPNHLLLSRNTADKVVLVTGAGGSIGSELCRQILSLNPKRLVMFEMNEYALYALNEELVLRAQDMGVECLPVLGSVRDRERLQTVFAEHKPDTVYHAAAYKHVPLVEHNPAEGIWNNTLGTLNTAQAAAQANVSDFVLISTDKAVRPTNVMGASKRLAEMVLQALAAKGGGTRFSMVRFGNVLGSSGSVVPKFRQQIRDGGPITLTHPEMTRYFMSIPEAAQLVIQAGAMAKGGEVFVLDMGQPVRIIDLASRMVELSGLSLRNAQNPDGDIEIDIMGLRPGEKLYEELLIGDNPKPTQHPRIMQAQEDFLPWPTLLMEIQALLEALQKHDHQRLRELLIRLVSGYTPGETAADLKIAAKP
jgi:FlaA1/EpsC-like NDP-sugar epimerase